MFEFNATRTEYSVRLIQDYKYQKLSAIILSPSTGHNSDKSFSGIASLYDLRPNSDETTVWLKINTFELKIFNDQGLHLIKNVLLPYITCVSKNTINIISRILQSPAVHIKDSWVPSSLNYL